MRLTSLFFALTLLSTVASCASPEVAEDSPPTSDTKHVIAAASAPYTSFCQKRYLKDQGGRLHCNWYATFSEACEITAFQKYIEKGAVTSGPAAAGKCSNGSDVVKLVHN